MKRTVLILCAFVLVVVAAGCNAPAEVNPNQANPAVEQPTALPSCYEEHSQIGQSVADTFSVSYDQVMSWFCSGYEYDDILLALQTSQTMDIDLTPEQLLELRASGQSWDEIWANLGLTD